MIEQLAPFGFISGPGTAFDSSKNSVTVFFACSKMRSGDVLKLEIVNQVAASDW